VTEITKKNIASCHPHKVKYLVLQLKSKT